LLSEGWNSDPHWTYEYYWNLYDLTITEVTGNLVAFETGWDYRGEGNPPVHEPFPWEWPPDGDYFQWYDVMASGDADLFTIGVRRYDTTTGGERWRKTWWYNAAGPGLLWPVPGPIKVYYSGSTKQWEDGSPDDLIYEYDHTPDGVYVGQCALPSPEMDMTDWTLMHKAIWTAFIKQKYTLLRGIATTTAGSPERAAAEQSVIDWYEGNYGGDDPPPDDGGDPTPDPIVVPPPDDGGGGDDGGGDGIPPGDWGWNPPGDGDEPPPDDGEPDPPDPPPDDPDTWLREDLIYGHWFDFQELLRTKLPIIDNVLWLIRSEYSESLGVMVLSLPYPADKVIQIDLAAWSALRWVQIFRGGLYWALWVLLLGGVIKVIRTW
jgi:hypothetical protein